MTQVAINGVQLHVEQNGKGNETVLFCHGLLFSGKMFDQQVAYLGERFRCVRVDFRGQGQSEVANSGYDLETLTDDIIALIEHLDLAPCHLVGFSMGGMVGMRVALARPDLLKSLVLMNTSAEAENWRKRPRFAALNLVARWFGIDKVAPRILDLLFSPRFATDPALAEARQRWMAYVLSNDRIGVTRAVRGVTSRGSVLEALDRIKLPTLIVTSDQDITTPPEKAERMQARIAGAELATIAEAGHMSVAEQPEAVNQLLDAFLTEQSKISDAQSVP